MDFEGNLGECMEQAGMARYQPDEELRLDEDGAWNSDRFVTLTLLSIRKGAFFKIPKGMT